MLIHPAVKGALTSILGPEYMIHPHRHCHLTKAKEPGQNNHQDSYGDDETRDAFRQLDELNAVAKYTELKDVGHNASAYGFAYTGDDAGRGFVTHYAGDRCDKTANVWDWLFAQKRG